MLSLAALHYAKNGNEAYNSLNEVYEDLI
jgi:hypothetical protein